MVKLEDGIYLSKSDKLFLTPVFLIILLMILKASIFQLPHGDQDFRWFFLPRQMMKTGSFSFYPPLTESDYNIYFFTESFPPIVSFSYFFLFSAYGSAEDFLVFVPVSLQFIFLLIFGYKLAVCLYRSNSAGIFAVMLLSSSTLLFYSFVICQETGLTALSLIALIFFLHDGIPDWRTAMLAAFSTALGALSREYGGIILICGIIVLLTKKMPIRFIIQYVLFSSILIMPWYLRTFILTGNPFYSNRFLGLPVNEVHAGIIDGYKETIGLQTYMNYQIIRPFLYGIFSVAGLVITTGIISFFKKPRFIFVPLITLIFIMLWLYSIWIPAGLFHSMRILSPAISLLAVSGVSTMMGLIKLRFAEKFIRLLLFLVVCFTLIQNVFVPLNPLNLRKNDLLIAASILPDPQDPLEEILQDFSLLPKHARVLTDGALQHAYVSNNRELFSDIQLVPVWSPEVFFIFDNKIDLKEACNRLKARGIGYVFLGTKANLNMNYLHKFKFFRELDTFAEPLIEGRLYKLPGNYENF